ncbi:MAG: GNAT family N-acetyltransferase [Butyrivibrio sp.]|nr:GNAT family N-acetyltransferase [Butyrivibrio sp.]
MNKDIDITNVVLHTERLLLRAWQETDLDDFFEYASVDGVGQMAGWLPHKNKEETMQILNMFISEKKTFAIVYNKKVIGSVGIERYNENELPEYNDKMGREIGYVLSKDYWRQGIMTEAVQEVIRWLFDEEKLDFIVCGHFDYNMRSQRVQEKCGFVHYKMNKYETQYGKVEDNWISVLER